MFKYTRHLIVTVIALLGVAIIFSAGWAFLYFHSFATKDFTLGANFSKSYAQYLGLDWQKTYLAMLDDLKIKNVRLSAPWNDIEPSQGKWNFTDLDWQIKQANVLGVNVVLVIGRRTPHWPECHDPSWIKSLAEPLVVDQQMEMLTAVVNRYKNNSAMKIWQVENEPLVDVFGECPSSDINLLKKEISLVKTLDPSRPVLVTDSGELSWWVAAANVGDLFGTTLYRATYNGLTGYFYYNLSPIFYNLKARLVGREPSNVLIAELQAEPWSPSGVLDVALSEQFKTMDAKKLVNYVDYAKRTGFGGAYLWGAEWW
ncbi:MAG: beta-galactosidase, partial [Parcubacteria group bacterium]